MKNWIAFSGPVRVAKGTPDVVVPAVKAFLDANPTLSVLVFDAVTSAPVELDLRGTVEEALKAVVTPEPKRTRGRPKLGVVSKEVTLLPRHWEWLQGQNGGASVTLRKLVETAMKAEPNRANQQQALESVYKFMTAVAGNEPGYEEATRALFAKDDAKFRKHTRKWPKDVRKHARKLAEMALLTT